MRDPGRWAKIVSVAGGVGLVVGSLDPLEGSALILAGSALFGRSANGGVGGDSGRSMWWAVLILPYAIGWSLDLWGPGSAPWITMAGVGIGLWYRAIAALGVFTLVACVVRLRMPSRAVT